MLRGHDVVQRLRNRLEDVANLKRHRNFDGLVQTGQTHKPVAIPLVWSCVLVGFVVLHHHGVGKRSRRHHAATHQQLLTNTQLVVERHLAGHRFVQHVQTLNLCVEERNQGVGYMHAWRRTALVKVHGLQGHQRGFHF